MEQSIQPISGKRILGMFGTSKMEFRTVPTVITDKLQAKQAEKANVFKKLKRQCVKRQYDGRKKCNRPNQVNQQQTITTTAIAQPNKFFHLTFTNNSIVYTGSSLVPNSRSKCHHFTTVMSTPPQLLSISSIYACTPSPPSTPAAAIKAETTTARLTPMLGEYLLVVEEAGMIDDDPSLWFLPDSRGSSPLLSF